MLLYRFIDVSAFIDIIASSQMYLRQVMTWDNPYETDAVTHLISNLLEKMICNSRPFTGRIS